MTLDLQYSIGDKVRLAELDLPARIMGISISDTGLQYKLRWLCGGDPKLEWFYPVEIEPWKDRAAANPPFKS